MTNYGYTLKLELDFDSAVKETKKALLEQGFGALFEIDIQAKLKEKLDKQMDEYLILGACNPSLASKALDTEIEIGLLLPCNVIVYIKDGETNVSAILPSVAMSFLDNDNLTCVKDEAEYKLKKAIDDLRLHQKIL
jgi:uncharacterized protein (DUF302 family)